MTLTSTTFTLTPNQYDGRQRLSDPAGTYQPPAQTLQPVTGLAISNTTSSSQTLSWQHDEGDGIEGYVIDIWVTNQDSTWRRLTAVAVGTKTYVSSGLPGGRYVRYRVAAAIETPYQISAWTEVDGNTLAAPGGGTETNLLQLTWFYNFEHLSPGESISGRDGFSTCDNFTCDAGKQPVAPNGTRCGHTFHDTNSSSEDGGYGEWGYAQNGLPNPVEGCEVWWRTAIFWPTNAYYGSSGALLKQMRFRRHSIAGTENRGSTETGLNSDKTLRLSVEFVDKYLTDEYGNPTTSYKFDNAVITFGRWVWYETYMLLSPDPNVGEVAVWIDGEPSGRVTTPTLSRPSAGADKQDEYFYGTYWNGFDSSRPYSEQWYDQIAIAQDGPIQGGTANDKQYLATDSQGYRYIGTATNTDIIR